MKILMLQTYYGGIGWWRFETPARALRALGHTVDCPTADQAAFAINRCKGMEGWLNEIMPNYDLVHSGYSGDANYAIGLFKARDATGVPVITDIDDDIDAVPTYNKGWHAFRPGGRGQRIAKTQLAHSDAITFSTEPLAETLGYLAKDKPSAVLGNWIDIDSWDHPTPPERSQDAGVRLMVTGGNGRYGDWEILHDPLCWAMEHYPALRLFFMGATPEWVRPWMLDKRNPRANRCFYIQPTLKVSLFNQVVRYIAPDILCSPVMENKFNRSKSGLKFLEAALAGAAFLCTDYPTYDVAPKGTCLKVSNTPTQWRESLAALMEDKSLRLKLADAAKSHVLDTCSAEKYVLERERFYETVLSGRSHCGYGGEHSLVGQTPEHQERTDNESMRA